MYIEDFLDKADKIKDKNGKSSSAKVRSAVACAMVGVIVGLMVGHSKNWNLFYAGVTGAAVGGAVGSLLVPKS